MAYIGKSPDGTGVRSRFYYTQSSGGGTSVTGSSDDGTSLTFSDGAYVDVFLNGVLLVAGTDYNTTTANTIAGLAALANGDVVEVVVYDIFTVADTVSALNGGTFTGAVTFDGNAKFGDNDKAQFGAADDLEIYHDGSNSVIEESGVGVLNLKTNGSKIAMMTGNDETMLNAKKNGAVELYHDNAKKIETTSAGVAVTGSATMTGTDTFNSNATGSGILLKDSGVTSRQLHIAAPGSVSEAVIGTPNSHNLTFATANSERMRIDSSGLVSIGNTIASSFNSGANNLVVGTGSGSEGITIYGGNESNIFFADGTDTADNLRGRIEYSHLSEAMLVYVNNSYVGRINSDGRVNIGGTTGTIISGSEKLTVEGAMAAKNTGTVCLGTNRTDDGNIVGFQGNGVLEGTISISGTTVSYNGGHLSRWSQLTDGTEDTTIVKGTVMTNLDQMAVWHHADKAATYYEEGDVLPEGVSVGDEKTPFVAAHNEDNEQLNCMAVSSVEGDANVAGVFVNWDNDDDDFNDMNVAMTGDMVIRIASGTTVARGDLLVSAGDGTAKPQGDDIVRSKTIAKVTSTTKSHTYDDGSYLVPCVLMAC